MPSLYTNFINPETLSSILAAFMCSLRITSCKVVNSCRKCLTTSKGLTILQGLITLSDLTTLQGCHKIATTLEIFMWVVALYQVYIHAVTLHINLNRLCTCLNLYCFTVTKSTHFTLP